MPGRAYRMSTTHEHAQRLDTSASMHALVHARQGMSVTLASLSKASLWSLTHVLGHRPNFHRMHAHA